MISTEKLFCRLGEITKDIHALYETGITRGLYLGFENLHEYYSFKMKGTTYIYSAPFSGKTEFSFELMMNLTELYGYHHVIYSPETGDPADIYAELISKYIQKPFFKNIKGFMDEAERLKAEAFIHEYFIIIDPKDKDLTIEDFYALVLQIEKEYDIHVDVTWCDPFNELKHNFSGDSGRQDLYIENRLGYIRKDARTNNRHNVIITHCTDQAHIQTKDGKRYYPPPSPREIAGGQAWFRKAMNMICVWRPPEGLIDDETGTPYKEDEVHIIIHKYKPKGIGKKGKSKLYLDKHRNRYYELLETGEKRYAGKQLPKVAEVVEFPFSDKRITPNRDEEIEPAF